MSEIRNIIVALVGCCLAASCSTDETPADRLPDGKYPLTFTTAVDETADTRATADTRTMTATRTVTSTRATTDGTWRGDGSEKIAVQIADEVREYVAHGSGNSAQLTSDTPFYWQTSGETKDVRGWYYGTGYSDVLKSAWAVQSDQRYAGGLVESEGYRQSDFLYAPVQPVSFRDESKELVFYHQTARVVIHIVKAEAANTATISEIKIGDQDNLALSGAYTAPTASNVHTGTWDVSGGSGSSVTMGTILPNTLPVSDAGKYLASYTALVIPQKMSEKANRKFIAVTLSDGNTYYYTPKGTDADLESGKEYTYNITVKYGYLEVDVVTGSVWGGDGTSIAVGSETFVAGFSSSDLKIGDYYYSDGSTSDGGYRKYAKDGSTKLLEIFPVLVNPETGVKRTVVGIVFWAGDATAKDKTLKKDHGDCTHGLVVALGGDEKIAWQDPFSFVQEWLNSNNSEGYLAVASVNGANDPVNNIQGYNNTKAIEAFNDANPDNIVQVVQKVIEYRTEVRAPDNSSGWYLPSAKELTLLCGGEVSDIWNNDAGVVNRNIINGKLELMGASSLQSDYYWSSTELDGGWAWCVRFGSGGVGGYNKDNYSYWVRVVLAY